jgi:hypothetical protein
LRRMSAKVLPQTSDSDVAAWFFYSKAITRSLKWIGCFGMRDRRLGSDPPQPPEKVGRRNGGAAVSMPLAESSHHRPMNGGGSAAVSMPLAECSHRRPMTVVATAKPKPLCNAGV